MNATEFLSRVHAFASRLGVIKGTRVVIGVSGGADSTALLVVAKQLEWDVKVIHFNHHLRNEEAIRDRHFVEGLCDRLGVPLQVIDLDVKGYAAQAGISHEMAGRELRYHRFADAYLDGDCEFIMTAHHSDDNIETVMLNALRGTGVHGLAGMRPLNRHLVRPLLCVTRADIEDFLIEIGQPWVDDSTNKENLYQRNRLRNIVLPTLEEQFPGARKRLLNTIEATASGVALYDELLQEAFKNIIGYVAYNGVVIERVDLVRLNKYINAQTLMFEWLHPRGFNAEQVRDFMNAVACSRAGAEFISSNYTLLLDSHSADLVRNFYIEIDDSEVPFNQVDDSMFYLTHGIMPFDTSMIDGRTTIALPNELFYYNYEFKLRHRRNGDRIRLYGMRGTRAVNDVLADNKVPTFERRTAWLLMRGDEVLWIVGVRASAACVVKEGSTDYVIIEYNPRVPYLS